MAENVNLLDFMSPELKKQTFDAPTNSLLERCDVWSCGFLFFRMFYGENPNFDENVKPVFPRNKMISDKLKYYITICLSLDYQKRPDWRILVTGDIL